MENDDDLTNVEIRQGRQYLIEYGYCVFHYIQSIGSDDCQVKLSKGVLDGFVSLLDNKVGRTYIFEHPMFPKVFSEVVAEKSKSRNLAARDD
jgi:hypothetical protein